MLVPMSGAGGVLWLCATCGVEHPAAPDPPGRCEICTDERQYVPLTGQPWTTLAELEAAGRATHVRAVEPGLWGITVEPRTGIGQQALLVVTPRGNLLWDVPAYIDPAGVARVRELGGIAAIAASHPHMYGVQLEWSAAFDDAPVYVAEADRRWLARTGPAVRTWSEPFEVLPGVTLTQPGGHFPGSAAAHWLGADGRGVLLTGDTIYPVQDPGWVTFMRSYPNYIPLSAAVVRRVADSVAGLEFDRLYGNFGNAVRSDAREAVRRSAERYIAWVSGSRDADA